MDPKKNRWTLVFALALVAGLTLGTYQVYRSIKEPFRGLAEEQPETTVARGELMDLQNRDTDRDGINDFDELYSTQTSPYLPDSDSDGITDKDELDNGQDPNCPEGRTCNQTIANSNTATELANLFNLDENSPANTNGSVDNANVTAGGDLNPPADQVPIAQLREALKKSGAAADVIDNLDDATLRSMYADVLAQETDAITNTAANTNAPANTNAANANANTSNVNSAGTITLEEINALTPDQIRQLLIETGISAETLQTMDDDLLKSIFIQAWQEETTTNTNG